MLDAADILIDRHHAVGDRTVSGTRRPGIGEADEVPGRIDEGVHGIGLAPRRTAACGACNVLPGRMTLERIARTIEIDIVRQRDR